MHAGHAQIEKYPGKRPILVIEYPWKVHSRPSVELRMLEPREADRDPSKIHSLRFVSDFMKSEVTDTVYGARDHAGEIPFQKKLAKFGREFEVPRRTNQLGKPGVTVTFDSKATGGNGSPCGLLPSRILGVGCADTSLRTSCRFFRSQSGPHLVLAGSQRTMGGNGGLARFVNIGHFRNIF